MSSQSGEFQSIFRWSPLKRLPPEEFQRWANGDPPSPKGHIIVFGGKKHAHGRNIEHPQDLKNELIANPNESFDLLIERSSPTNDPELGHTLSFQDQDRVSRVHLRTINFQADTSHKDPVTISKVGSRNLRIVGKMRSDVKLIDCWIEALHIHPNSQLNMEIAESHIARFELGSACLNSLTIRDSSLGSVRFDKGTKGAIIGNARFTNVITPRGASWYTKKGLDEADQWAQAKRDLANLGNEWAAGLFHATEMSIRSREASSTLVREIGRFYEDACDYGNSVTRPVLWLVFFLSFFWVAYALLEPGSPSMVDETKCVGWITNLCGEGSWALFWRTLYLSAHPVLNPLAGITGSSVVTPGGPAYLLSIFHRILSLVLVFLIIVAVRRRFRLTVG